MKISFLWNEKRRIWKDSKYGINEKDEKNLKGMK